MGCKEYLRALRESRKVRQPVIQDLVEAEHIVGNFCGVKNIFVAS